MTPMFKGSCENAILYHVSSSLPGRAFAVADFSDFGTYDAIRQSLSRLTQKNFLVRIVPGIYCRNDTLADEPPELPPSEEIARAIARNSEWSILPGTELARYILGLSDAPPTHPTYLSSGPNSRYTYGNNQRLFMVHSAGKFLGTFPHDAALVISALMDLDNHKITVAEINHLAQTVPPAVKEYLLKNLSLVPPRLRPIVEILNDQYGRTGR